MTNTAEDPAALGEQTPAKGVEEYPTSVMDAFLQHVPPGSWRTISNQWCEPNEYGSANLRLPKLTLHCPRCAGGRHFDPVEKGPLVPKPASTRKPSEARFRTAVVAYRCRNCKSQGKDFALSIDTHRQALLKLGEDPAFGQKIPRRVLNLFGEDKDVLLKGKQCENHGLGVGAFSYYRRLVEKRRNTLFELIISVAEANAADAEILATLKMARAERQFDKSFEIVGESVPQSIKVDGQNPLTILYAALSEGIHGLTDEECLKRAQAARTVLELVVTKVDTALAEREEIRRALGQLTHRGGKLTKALAAEPGPAVLAASRASEPATDVAMPDEVLAAEEET
jgi:hypothetical protein